MFPEHVETRRLHLRRFDTAVDATAAHGLFGRDDATERMLAYVTKDPHDTRAETHDALRALADDWTDGEAARYAIYPKAGEDGACELAGDASLLPQWANRSTYFGVRLRRRFWGRGYSGERAAALLTVAFDHLDLELAMAACHPDNQRSERAIEKWVDRFGGRYVGRLRNMLPLADSVAAVHQWSVHREEFAANRPAAGEVIVGG